MDLRSSARVNCRPAVVMLGPVRRIELPKLDEDVQPTPDWGVWRRRRVSHVAADRIISMLNLKHSIEHEKLLAPVMGMRRKSGCQERNGRLAQASATPLPIRSSMRWWTPDIGEATQPSLPAWTTAQRSKAIRN